MCFCICLTILLSLVSFPQVGAWSSGSASYGEEAHDVVWTATFADCHNCHLALQDGDYRLQILCYALVLQDLRSCWTFPGEAKKKKTLIVFSATSSSSEIYKRLLQLCYSSEEEMAALKVPADVADENGEAVIDERKIRINPCFLELAKHQFLHLQKIPHHDSGLMSCRRSLPDRSWPI